MKKYTFKNKQGFTLIELLIVVAIMGVLAGAIMVFTGGSKAKAQLASFKSETRGSYAGLANQCTTTGVAFAAPADTAVTNWAVAFSTPCSSNGKFTLIAVPVNTSIDCTATVDENGVTYTGAGCN